MPRLIRPATLRNASEEIDRHATWLEIFFDLIFAVIVIQLSDKVLDKLTLSSIIQGTALFIPIMWTWVNYTVFAARFDNNDGIHWFLTFAIMFAGIIMAIQIPKAFEQGATGFSIGFIIGQLALLLLYARTFDRKSTSNNLTWFYLMGFGLGTVVWIMSLFFVPPVQFIFWLMGMCIYVIVPWIGRRKILSQAPLNTIYIPERFGSFTVIILGQVIASVVFGLEYAHWNPYSIITSFMAFILAIIIWGKYYKFIQNANYKCTLGSGQPYIYAHIPLIISLLIIGVCVKDFIKEPLLTHYYVNILFCSAIILYLTAFYLLQYVALKKLQIQGVSYLLGVIATLVLFFGFPLTSVWIMSGVVVVFMALFISQFYR